MDFAQSLAEWAKDKPLSILQLDPADRAVLKIADERDAIQKKTFTKWVNKHLKRTSHHVEELFDDLRDGHNLISLLEVLSGEMLPRERGKMKFHQLQNVETALKLLKSRRIKLVNIRPEDIVDGNPKLTLGLIWTIILHFQISDIITGSADESLTAREALLKWVQRTTERYPGVRVTDFTASWKDGLAFNAILHRNRPDLLDFRSLRTKSAKENLECAFSLAEREFGITRLLDPEDVDTPEPDEKSLITYISSMYDVFPDPPSHHPFADDEKNRKVQDYIEFARNLLVWIQESVEMFSDKKLTNSVIDMKALLLEFSKFRSDELPKRLRDKQKLSQLYREIQKVHRDSGLVELDRQLQMEDIEQKWNRLMTAMQEKDQKIRDEICRLEKLQRLAEKVNKESKQFDSKLDEIDKRIKEEDKRINRLHPIDIKHNCDQIENDLKQVNDFLKSSRKDISTLENKKYHQISELKQRYENLSEKQSCLRATFQSVLLDVLATRSAKTDDKKVPKQKIIEYGQKSPEQNSAPPSLKEHFEWIEKRQKRISLIDFGNDVQSMKMNIEQLKMEIKGIDQYKKRIELCSSQKISFKDSDYEDYCNTLKKLEDSYKELVKSAEEKQIHHEVLLDFVQSLNKEIKWLSEKEDVEISRDWAAKTLHLVELEHYQETLTSDLEKHEIQLNVIQNKGESLLLQKHPASKSIEGYLNNMQCQWSWLLQLTLCLEVHLRFAQAYHQFFKEARECDQWIKKTEEKLNNAFSKSISSVDEGERSLKQMQLLKEDLAQYNDIIISLMQRSSDIIPLKARKLHQSKPLKVIAICNYKSGNGSVAKDEQCTLKDNTQKLWKIKTSAGTDCAVPGVCFVIPAPSSEAVELGESLKSRYDDVLNLWALKQKKMRQNLILVTIKAVKAWDDSQIRSMDATQRESIMRALNEDAQKLINEGSNTEPALVKLKEEMNQCNTMFNSMVQKLSSDETKVSSKTADRKLQDIIATFQSLIAEKEKFLKGKLQASTIWDLDLLENLVIEHKEFEVSLRACEDHMDEIVQSYKNTSKKTTMLQTKYDTLHHTWDRIWEMSNIYVERLKAIEVGLLRYNEAIQVVSNIEVQLASSDNLQSNIEELHRAHDKLLSIQLEMQQQQSAIDDLQESLKKLKSLALHIKSKHNIRTDVSKFENDVKKLVSRWNNASSQIVERLRSCGASSELLRSYKTKVEQDNVWITETTVKVNNSKTVRRMTTKEISMAMEPAINLYSSIVERSSSIDETNTLGERYIREAQVAVSENYRICNENASKLFSWMGDVEAKLSNLGVIREQLPALQDQINNAKVLKDELEHQQHLVTSTLDQMRQLVQQGLEILKKDEINQLQKNVISLKKQYDTITTECDRILRRLLTAFDELRKFKMELDTFKTWLNKAFAELAKKEIEVSDLSKLEQNIESLRIFSNDVIAHQADLRFITMVGQKFTDESQEYLKALNIFRGSLSQSLAHIKPTESEVKAEVQEVTIVYHNLLNDVNRLTDHFSVTCNKYHLYVESSEKAKLWISDIKKSSEKALVEPTADEPHGVQEQLDKMKYLNMEVVSQSRLIDQAFQASKILINSVDVSNTTSNSIRKIEDSMTFIQKDYTELVDCITKKIEQLQFALIRSHDIQDGLDRTLKWLDETEVTMNTHSKPISLTVEKLDEQRQGFKMLTSDINNQRQSIEMLNASAKELMNSANTKLAKKLESKLNDIAQRYTKLCRRVSERAELIGEISDSVQVFNAKVMQFEEWISTTFDRIEGADFANLDVDGFASAIEYTMNHRNSKKEDYEQTIKIARNLIAKKDVTDVSLIKNKIKCLEQQWKNLDDILTEKKQLGKLRAEQMKSYSTLRVKVLDWLLQMERSVERIEPPVLDQTALKKQASEIMPLAKDCSDFGSTIEKLNNMGNTCDALVKNDHTKRKITNLEKKMTSPTQKSPSGSKSGDSLPTSPVKGQLSTQSPLSTVSSGFSSRRSSTENIGVIEGMSIIQHQLSEMNQRYNLLCSKVSDQTQEINSTIDEVASCLDSKKKLDLYIESKEKIISKDKVSISKEYSESHLKLLKETQEDMLEKQSDVDQLKVSIKNMLLKRKSVKGASELEEGLCRTEKNWLLVSSNIKHRLSYLQDLRDFNDSQLLLSNWLSQRQKMFEVLGPIASEPRMVSAQVQQVQVMKDEFNTQKSFLSRFDESGNSVLQYLQKTNSNSKKITETMRKVHQLWEELSEKLGERERNLEAANGIANDFHQRLTQLQEKLQFISDSYDSMQESSLYLDVTLKKLNELETSLESQRPLLTDVDSICEQLCEVVSDSASKTEIKYKINLLEKLYSNLKRKIDNRKAEIRSSMKEDEVFYKSCEDVQHWLKEIDQILSQTLYISANLSTLTTQVREYEPTYKQIMNKEHEVHLCLSKGADMMSKLAKQESSTLKAKLDNIKKLWEKLKKTAVERHTCLQSCLENCKNYHSSIESFLPLLEAQEQKTRSFKPISLKRDIINKQLKEAQGLKNNLSIYLQSFENIKHIGETLVSNCQIEKDSILKQSDAISNRWIQLNNGVSARIHSLEDVSQILLEYQEKLRDLQHAIQRLEDRLASHDMLGDVSRDPIVIERLKLLLEETTSIKNELQSVRKFSKTVISKVEQGSETADILQNLDLIDKRHQTLTKKLEDRCSSLKTASEVFTVFMDQVKHVRTELNCLDETFDKMSPVARNKEHLNKQILEIKNFKSFISKAKENLATSDIQCKNMVSQGYMTDSKTCEEQLKTLSRQIIRLEEHVRSRETTITTIIKRLETFSNIYNKTRTDLNAVLKEEEMFGSIGGDVDIIRSQQSTFKKFRTDRILFLCKQMSEVNKMGQGIVQSAATGVDTNMLEQQLESLNDSWNTLQEQVNEREKKLDIALLQSGKFQEALTGVQKWLNDTEEMVCNQKPPSSDFKVVKAQIQEQKFLKKMLLDRQSSVISLKVMGDELKQGSKSIENEQVEGLMTNISHRFEELITTAQTRMSTLERTIPVTQELQKVSSPLIEWMETTQKKLLSMSVIPIEEKSVKTVITEHKRISQDISTQKVSLEQLNSITQKLSKMISKDESESLVQKVQTFNQQYEEIINSDKKLDAMLKDAVRGASKFSTSYNSTITWMQKITVTLTRHQNISVYSDKLQLQIKELRKLKTELDVEKSKVDEVITSGKELMKHASGEDAIQLKEKLDTLNVQYIDITNRLNEKLKLAEESLPQVQSFYSANSKLSTWLDGVEKKIKIMDTCALDSQEETIKKLQEEIVEYRLVLETINHTGPRLCQISSDDGTAAIESITSKTNQRFDGFCEQVQRKAERIELAVRRKFDVVGDMDEVLDWFQEIEQQVSEAEGLSSELESLTVILKEQKCLNEEVNSQKNRVRDIIASAKKLMRESSSEDLSFIREKVENLKLLTSNVSSLCQERLSTLEQAIPLAEHFFETHSDLGHWLDEVEGEAELLEAPALNSVQIRKQQDRNKGLVQSVHEHKPLVDKLNKTGSALTKLCKEEEMDKLQIILESDNSRYNALRKILREHQSALEEALQATSQFSDKLEGMLSALTSTADQLHNAEPISAHPERIQEQINDNKAVLHDLDKRTITLEAVKKAADDVIVKASTIDEPAVRDIKMKLDRLNDLWTTIQTAAFNRGKSLEEALIAAEKFWDELTAVMKALKELQVNLNSQDPPALEPTAVQQQQEVLQEINKEITHTKPEVDHCRKAGQNLMQLCGEPDKPEVKRHIEDLDSVWDNVTTLYAKREQNLVAAMEKAMTFHNTLQSILEFLDTVEENFSKLGPVSSDIESVKLQIDQLKEFKLEVDPHMIEVESLNRQAQELMERTAPNQATSIRKPLAEINRRWDTLLKNIVKRQQDMENILLQLGQFQHALEQLKIWISKTGRTLDELKPVFGDPQVIEVVLAKHKVLTNDIQAHQASIDTINRASRQFVNSNQESEESKFTHNMIQNLNSDWQQLQDKSSSRQKELEEALKEAQQFHQDIQDLLMWLSDLDSQLVTSKPVGGLPETAKEQLNRFMDMYNELDASRYKVENIFQQGQEYLKRSGESNTKGLQHNLRTLKQRWDSILNKANDRKIKLEIAVREATEFNDALQTFVEWLTNAEKYLTTLKPVSRCMKSVLDQIEDHRSFQKDVGSHREVMLNLDKKGTHLKYFSQKQDVILIKNLLISVQHRWERIVSKAAERTRALDHGYKESKEFHDAWTHLISWLDEAEKLLDDATPIGNDPYKIKKLLSKHKEFQRTLGSKQVTHDSCMKIGRSLKDKCPKQDVQILQEMLDELKVRWNKVCAKSVDKQRKLEEALLFSGQFKEAVLALLDWFDKAHASLLEAKPYHGDLDTVTSLIDKHKAFMEELKKRGQSLESIRLTAHDLEKCASPADIESISAQIGELEMKWQAVSDLSEKHKNNLNESLQQAERLYKSVHMLLEWLTDAEMKLRFIGPLPDDEDATNKQISEHSDFLKEMEKQEENKNFTLDLAQQILKKCHPDGISVIKHWITIIQSRWEEISVWARQRNQRLQDHLLSLRSINELLEELIAWLNRAESTLTSLEAEPLPDDLPTLDNLIKEHQAFMDGMSKKQPDVENVTKVFSTKRHPSKNIPHTSVKEKAKDRTFRTGTPVPLKTSTPLRHQAESDIKHPRAKFMLEKWRTVWLLAMERQRRLQDKYNYLKELDRIKHFDFNDWRRRYLGWLNNKKSRIMDQFKKIDKDNNGKVTKQEFIDGILKSKFSTSRPEMEHVANIFDKNGDGFIDSKEYIETLHPERDEGPKTEAEKIQDEVQRQVAKCTCVHRFKVYQVGEGKYRFGDSQKLRLVRILRSTVMVRVGGGWVALDEFLVKNDPCRAKGRTNVELREQFILADGVSQSMSPFKAKPSPNSSVSSQSGMPHSSNSMPSAGPITKIREKSERSAPMRPSRCSAENSSDISGPSFNETDSFSSRSGYSRNTPSSTWISSRNKPQRKSSSNQGSRPSSRTPSDLSQDAIDESKCNRKSTSNRQNLAKNSLSSESNGSKIPSIKKSSPSV